ncbi:MAG: LamG-like jellyroll fold domain-containing protein [Nannocystaceae bacterium]|nr:LamG domain-containing protein [bacterium]
MRFAWTVGVLSVLSGCGATAFQCENDLDCVRGSRPAGTCEVVGYCSFPDSGCASGQRYAEFSDAFGGLCVPADGSSMSASSGVTEGGGSSSSSSTGASASGNSGTSTPATTVEPTTGTLTTGPDETDSAETTGADASTGEVTESDLVLWLDFEPGDADKSDYNHTVSCAPVCPAGTSGPLGSAALFNDEFIEVAAHPAFDFSGDFTFTVWLRFDEMNGLLRANVVAQQYAPDATAFDLSVQDLDGDALYDLVLGAESMGIGITDRVQDGVWHFVAVRMQSGQQEVFVDEELVSSGPITVPSSQNAPLFVGGLPAFGFPLEGALDDLRIYRRILSDGELTTVRAGDPLD